MESKLWSDRTQERASRSLRQALSDIRDQLGLHADLLGADRVDVWLDTARVETDLEPGCRFRQAGRDFLEGFDVRDDSFEDWLRDMRQQHPVEHLAAPLPKAKSDS
ncbi:MAG: hypothetical protein OIF38_10320, partial [Cellvibrionaceae bacterium]|nr:hypothetical protein [Cellvibrionaceae bacterium]